MFFKSLLNKKICVTTDRKDAQIADLPRRVLQPIIKFGLLAVYGYIQLLPILAQYLALSIVLTKSLFMIKY